MKTCRRRDQVQWRLSRARGRTSLVSISFDLTKMTVADSSVDKISVGVETNPRERLSGDVDDDKATSPTKTASTIDQQNTLCRKFSLSHRQHRHRQRRRLSNVVRSSICVVVSTILAVVASAQSNEDSSLLPKNGKKINTCNTAYYILLPYLNIKASLKLLFLFDLFNSEMFISPPGTRSAVLQFSFIICLPHNLMPLIL